MTYTPTNRPVPSDAPEDLYFNSSKLDEYINSDAATMLDRKGVLRTTLTGIQEASAGLAADLANTLDPSKGIALVGGVIAENKVLNIPGDFPSIAAAMAYLRGFTIARGAIVTLQVNPTATLAFSLSILNHMQGSQIQIIGNLASPASCILEDSSGTAGDGLVVSSGYAFGLIDGLTIRRTAAGPAGTGALALTGGNLRLGPNMHIENWYYGAAERDGSVLYCRGIQVSGAGDVGIWGFNGGSVDCAGATVTGSSDVANDLGYGIQAEYGASVECGGAQATGNRKAGIAALHGGTVRCHGSNASSNLGDGFFVDDMSKLIVNGSVANNNGKWGFNPSGNGRVSGSFTGTGNTLGLNKPVAALDNVGDTPNARVFSNTGTEMLVASNGTDGVRAVVAGNTSARFGTEAGAGLGANYVQLDAAVAGQPAKLKGRGSDTNISVMGDPKGSGNFGMLTSAWNTPHLQLGGFHFWVDASGRLRIKNSAPTSDTDGTVVGAQT